MVSPPTAGASRMWRIDPSGGVWRKVTSVCHHEARSSRPSMFKTSGFPSIDGMTGSRLQLGAPFGLSLVEAGRFYGVGNNALGVYAVAVPVLGFILGTFLFLAAFMYVGGYRAHGVVWGASAGVTISCGILFLRIAYVSLPRGIAPFDRVTDAFFAIPSLW